jgi:alpha-glucosidase
MNTNSLPWKDDLRVVRGPHRGGPSKSIALVALALASLTYLLAQDPAVDAPSQPPSPTSPARGRGQGRGGQQPRSTSRRTQRVVPFPQIEVRSPNGAVAFILAANAERLTYTVKMGDVTVIEPSPLKFLVDGYDLACGVIFQKTERTEIKETFPWHGVHQTANNHANTATISFVNDLAMQPFTLEVRAFDDGIGYRFVVAGADNEVRTPEEFSQFVVPGRANLWFHDLNGHYEAEYQQARNSDVAAGQWAGTPLTFELPGGAGYGVIAEANLVNYSGMALEAGGRGAWIVGLGHRQPVNYPYELRYGREEAKRLGKPPAVTGTITTPWRVVMAGRDLNAIVNCDILADLCPPADPKLFPEGMNTPWCAPGLAVWKYVDGGGENSLEVMKDFSRLGGLIGAKYHILEGFAYGWSDEQIKDYVAYSQQQGVRVLFWRHSRQLRTPEAREEFFARLHRLGVAGAKIDFFDHEGKENVDLYAALIRKAAEYQCVVDFHGANKPTGQLRTWPNEMLREAVRGMESRSVHQRARHETILPFTRYLAGPCDYTTMIFDNAERRADSTWAHQIAALATLQSPMLTIAAHPQTILDNPAADVIKSIKPVWDETIVLPDSRIGELSVFARRSGDMWILAVMSARLGTTIHVPLSFLGEGDYKASYVRDDKVKPDAVTVEQAAAKRTDTLTIDLAAGGGFVGRFVR